MKWVKRPSLGVGGSLAAAAFALALAGCLFPSFDQFQDDAPATHDGGAAVSATRRDASPESPSASMSATPTTDAPPAVGDGGSVTLPDGGSVPKVVQCGGATCAVGSQFCCDGISVGCTDESRRDDCVLAQREHCDGNEDCPSGESCCALLTDPDVVCRVGCPGGVVVCTGTGQCPAGQSCTMPLGAFQRGCQ